MRARDTEIRQSPVPTRSDLPLDDELGVVRKVKDENKFYRCVTKSLALDEQWKPWTPRSGSTPGSETPADVAITPWQADIELDVDDDPLLVVAGVAGKRVYLEGFTILTGANAWSTEPSGVDFSDEDASLASVAAASLTANTIVNHTKATGITFFTPWVNGAGIGKSVKVAPSPSSLGGASALKIRVWGKIK